MKFRCIYCAHVFEADALPPACPGCSRTFSLTVGPRTTVKQLVRALAANGASPSFNLLRDALPDEDAPPDFALACAPYEREPTQDPGMVAVTDSLIDAVSPASAPNLMREQCDAQLKRRIWDARPKNIRAPDEDAEPRAPDCACHLEAGDSPWPVHGDNDR